MGGVNSYLIIYSVIAKCSTWNIFGAGSGDNTLPPQPQYVYIPPPNV